ncbi:asparagine synthase-related protein [Streptomyces filipinensis]|uniref:asparagine synthase-related protein n=1 Tax=Streptomyces filipinensis TaxID=66887 RepID=UPI001783CF23|nr:asparagine synthase-related protein [Streptomyces filipinensis]
MAPAARPGGRRAAFAASVGELTEGVETIGVAVSGGLDSLATLVHACRVADGRRVIAFTIDMTDDDGRSSVAVVRTLLRSLALEHVRLEVISPEDRRAAPWSALGPRRDALPELNAAVAARAAELGVGCCCPVTARMSCWACLATPRGRSPGGTGCGRRPATPPTWPAPGPA